MLSPSWLKGSQGKLATTHSNFFKSAAGRKTLENLRGVFQSPTSSGTPTHCCIRLFSNLDLWQNLESFHKRWNKDSKDIHSSDARRCRHLETSFEEGKKIVNQEQFRMRIVYYSGFVLSFKVSWKAKKYYIWLIPCHHLWNIDSKLSGKKQIFPLKHTSKS